MITPTMPMQRAMSRTRFASTLSSGMLGERISNSKKVKTVSQNSPAQARYSRNMAPISTIDES